MPAGRPPNRTWFLALLVLVLGAGAASPVLLIAFGIWMASGSWDFEGRGAYHWAFVRGSRLDTLGLVGATAAPARFSVSFEDGTFPGWRTVTYASTVAPAEVASAYAERCRAMGWRLVERLPPPPAADAARAELTCEIELYLNVEMLAERRPETAPTHVWLRVWGRQ
ncbi:MAG: hypothetical protein ACOYLQ_18475 [Hyphomicrobiaceae bacterium]|jgi:hypothetical protein